MVKPDANWTRAQKDIFLKMQQATDQVVAYAAPEVPLLGNLTPEGLLENLGPVNDAKKAVEKVEKILKERLKSQLNGAKTLRADNYEMKIAYADRVAINQGMAKETLGLLENVNVPALMKFLQENKSTLPEDLWQEELNIDTHMAVTEVATMRISGL